MHFRAISAVLLLILAVFTSYAGMYLRDDLDIVGALWVSNAPSYYNIEQWIARCVESCSSCQPTIDCLYALCPFLHLIQEL